MSHDIGLTAGYHDSQGRSEVDGAFAARDFLRACDIPERDVEKVWDAVAYHTTPGIPEHMHPEIYRPGRRRNGHGWSWLRRLRR
jgi:hypothetical protein